MENKGWICPRCDTVHNPFVMTCNCSTDKKITVVKKDPTAKKEVSMCYRCGVPVNSDKHSVSCKFNR